MTLSVSFPGFGPAGNALRASLLAAGLLATSPATLAIPFTPELDISGEISFGMVSGTSFSDGAVTQNGEIREIEGGAAAASAFSTSAGVADGLDDGTTVDPATNPLTATLTDIGDGFGWGTELGAEFATDDYDFYVDFNVDLKNLSLDSGYTVTIEMDFTQSADANGDDAFAVGELDVELDGSDVLSSIVASDTLAGDELNGSATGSFGALISDSGPFTFDVLLNPGAAATVSGFQNWYGGVFASGEVDYSASVDVSIAAVMCTFGACLNPTTTPEPGTLALLGLGLVVAMRRRARTQAARA